MLINNKNLIKTIKRVDLTNEQETNLNEMPEIKKNINDIKTIIGDNENGLIKDVKNLKENAVSQDSVNTAINNYFIEHPVQSGATEAQAAQIEANKTAIQTVNETIGNKNELPVGDANIIASINRIDSKASTGGTGLTSEQEAKLNSIDNKVDKINGKGLSTNDYTTEEKATLSNLKTVVGDTSSGLVKDVKDLKENGVSQDNINVAIENYLTEHPVASGATVEQAAQIEANRAAIGDSNSGLIKEMNDIKNIELQNLNAAIQTLETLVGLDETVGDKTGLPSGDANVIASINRIDSKTLSANNILISPDNSRFKLKVDNSGNLSTEKINEYGQIILSTEALTINEGEPGSFEVKLNSAPTQDEVINLSVDNSNCTVSPTQLSFNFTNYSVEQTVTVNTTRDSSSYDDKRSVITLSNDNINNKTVNVTIVNTDVAALSGISAVYTQGNVVIYEGDSLDRLKNNLVVTANYSDGSNNVVTDYVLSGNLTTGTSTITVTYQNKTTTFNVTVTANTSEEQQPILSFTKESGVNSNEWIDSVSGKIMTLNNTELKDDGVYFNGTNAWGQINDYALSEDNDFSIKTKFKWHSTTNRYAKLFYFRTDNVSKFGLRIELNVVSMYINDHESKANYTRYLNNDLEKDFIITISYKADTREIKYYCNDTLFLTETGSRNDVSKSMTSLFIGREGKENDSIEQYGNFTMDYLKIYDKVIK